MNFKVRVNEDYEDPCPESKCKVCCDTKVIIDLEDGFEWDCYNCIDDYGEETQ